jgi:hypothetical protein
MLLKAVATSLEGSAAEMASAAERPGDEYWNTPSFCLIGFTIERTSLPPSGRESDVIKSRALNGTESTAASHH